MVVVWREILNRLCERPILAVFRRSRQATIGQKPPLRFRVKLEHMEGRLGPLGANDKGRKPRFCWAKAVYQDTRRGSNLYSYFVNEQPYAVRKTPHRGQACPGAQRLTPRGPPSIMATDIRATSVAQPARNISL